MPTNSELRFKRKSWKTRATARQCLLLESTRLPTLQTPSIDPFTPAQRETCGPAMQVQQMCCFEQALARKTFHLGSFGRRYGPDEGFFSAHLLFCRNASASPPQSLN